MSVVNDIRMVKVYVAVIVDNKDISKQMIKAYGLIDSLDVPMYAVIREGVNWDSIKHISWRRVYYAKAPQDVPVFIDMINHEVSGGLFYT